MQIIETLLYGDRSLDAKSNTLILNATIDFLFVTKRFEINLFKLDMAVLYILVKFVDLFFHHYYFLYSQAYHSRYMTDDWEFYKKNSAMKLPRLKCEQPYFPIITNLVFNRET